MKIRAVGRLGATALFAALLTAVCGAVPTVAQAPAPPHAASPIDDEFVTAAVQIDNAELDMARLELAHHGNTDEARSFAQRMIADHSAIAAHLAHIAPAAVARVKQREGLVDKLTLVRLESLSPTELDQQYLLAQVGGHLSAMSVYQTEMLLGANRALKLFASGELPTLREHLEVAYMYASHVTGANPIKPPGSE